VRATSFPLKAVPCEAHNRVPCRAIATAAWKMRLATDGLHPHVEIWIKVRANRDIRRSRFDIPIRRLFSVAISLSIDSSSRRNHAIGRSVRRYKTSAKLKEESRITNPQLLIRERRARNAKDVAAMSSVACDIFQKPLP